MATKSFQDICVEYAHQLGKGLPLTAPEMCNAVIMYLNTQITEMQGITTALQTAVTEAEASATEAINKADDVSETVNALPKVPKPTTSDNGKVIGVQSGAYSLVDNIVTTDTNQIISGYKLFGTTVVFGYSNNQSDYTMSNNYYHGFHNNNYNSYIGTRPLTNSHVIYLPDKDGVFAFTDDIPDLDDYTGTMHIVQGTAGSGIAVHDTAKASPYTKYGYDKIETYGNSNALQYTLNIPNKNGTIATLDDIGSSSGSKLYLHNVTISSDKHGRIYASAITDFEYSFVSFSEIYDHIGQNVSGYYISGGEYYPIVATSIDERERIYVTVVINSSTETFEFDTAEYTDEVKII